MPDIYQLRSRAHDFEMWGPYEKAVETFDKVLELEPKDQYALIHKGVSLAKLEKYEEAIEMFDKALGISPLNSFALVNKAASLARLGKYKESMVLLDKAVETEPNDNSLLSDSRAVLRALKKQKEGGGDTQFYWGRTSFKPGPGEDRIKFVDVLASLFGSRLLLDESEEKLRTACQDMVDRWSEFTPEAHERKYKILQSLKDKEPLAMQNRVSSEGVSNISTDFFTIAKVVLIVFIIYVFIVGLGHVFGGSSQKKLTPELQSAAISQCTNWGGQAIYDNNGQYQDCAINGRVQ